MSVPAIDGGAITGAGTAWTRPTRGLSVALVEAVEAYLGFLACPAVLRHDAFLQVGGLTPGP